MAEDYALSGMKEAVRNIFDRYPDGAQDRIRELLETKLGHLSTDEKVAHIEKLARSFRSSGNDGGATGNEEVLTRICSLLLGRSVSGEDLSSSELLERLAESLNTIFDTLNQLVALIQMTLKGGGTGDETIRQVIGVHLEGEDQTESLESYLGQIKEAFWVAQEAFRQAAHVKFEQLLDELNPARMKEEQGKGFKFGPMRKAESFDTFEEKYGKIRQWFDSGRFNEEFLREFERNAQKLSSK